MGVPRRGAYCLLWVETGRPAGYSSTWMPIKSLFALTIILYVASGLLVANAARSWRNLARINRVSTRAFRKTARLTAISLAMLAGSLLCTLVGVLSNGSGALSPGRASKTANASVTVHLEEAKLPIEVALIRESDRFNRDCTIGQASACNSAGQIAIALESRGFCQPDASGRWVKTPVCAQINGKPDLTLGLPRAGSMDLSPPSMAGRDWRAARRKTPGAQ